MADLFRLKKVAGLGYFAQVRAKVVTKDTGWIVDEMEWGCIVDGKCLKDEVREFYISKEDDTSTPRSKREAVILIDEYIKWRDIQEGAVSYEIYNPE